MATLQMTLKKQWFDMILTGEKREEYREIKVYWRNRLFSQTCDSVYFRNGYTDDRPAMLVVLKDIKIGLGNPEWGAPTDKNVYILRLGSVLETKNCEQLTP